MIFTNQPITLSTAFTDDDGIVDLTGATIRYDYWYPANTTSTPTGSVDGIVVNESLGLASGVIPASINIWAATTWRVQGVAIISGDEYAECTTTFEVSSRGDSC